MAKNILLISPDFIGSKMAGPGIRYWNFAQELSKYFNVTLMTPNEPDINLENTNFCVVKLNENRLKERFANTDVIIIQGVTLFNYPVIKKAGIPIIVDIYDPFILENLELRKQLSLKDRIAYHESDLNILLDQLAYGDYFICASEKQKDYWLGMLSAINRVNPIVYNEDNTMDKLIGVVPFGLSSKEPIKTKNLLKGVYPGIDKNDKVIIWGGGIWNWFDPLTPIKAINEVSKIRNDVKLFFMGIKHPNPGITDMDMTNKAIKLSDQLGLTNKYVFFNYNWIPYDERHNYLLEADIGISCHFNHLETKFSFRTRLLDYLWCGLPMILTGGDYLSEIIAENNLGEVVSENNIDELKNSIIKIIDAPHDYTKNIAYVKQKFYWQNCISPIIGFCNNAKVKKDKILVNINHKNAQQYQNIKFYFIRIKKIFTREGIKKLIAKIISFLKIKFNY
jgi:glycosyltransferase involved in cell wall biosynthesis